MRMIDLIHKKRNNESLSKDEIEFIISNYVSDNIPDYQMSALSMAIFFNGMNDDEVANLTHAMAFSGETVDLSPIKGIKVDKHSSGGVGDKTSLIVLPLVASVGVPVAKMSGRGLGHTGGTLDKLEAIEGFKIELTNKEFIDNVNNVGMALVGQTANLVPADKKLYGLRDATSTVDSIPLIASSIMSKKIASGADAIVLDVKVGSGAFMKTIEEARKLGSIMVSIGKSLNRNTVAVLSNMDEPLGHEVGNANEIMEVVQVLKGQGEKKLTELSLTLASHMAVLGGKFDSYDEAYAEMSKLIENGQAINKFKEFISAQGGNPEFVDNLDKLPQAKNHFEIVSPKDGYVGFIDAEKIGLAAMMAGAGRKTKADPIDHSVGITLKAKTGDKVAKGDILAILHCNSEDSESKTLILDAYEISNEQIESKDIVFDVIS
ncbi:pyrimidine-nucleoside phosphorylase [Paenibacillus provencensis]|uniref:Pyrimidine-nucleoside phosphorylase n=1 Tax=Paenibacillus provencensis TaxID=441151 RepID=A0ABW3PK35_9BACL|nr:pyrimidine-nucleoside phosphorylase [Paenibacillus sp. MER 78]MCM3126498.1 pyrimidine-nucleoside phosphorylase [Paenibacillus sp. MER 78]